MRFIRFQLLCGLNPHQHRTIVTLARSETGCVKGPARAVSMSSNDKDGILKLFGIEPDEGPLVGRVVLQAALFGFQNLFTRTAVFALFLEAFTASDLPVLYILTGLLVPILGSGFTKYQNRVGNLRAYSMSLVVVFGLLALMVGVTHVPSVHNAALFALPVLYLGVYRFLDLVLAGTKNTVFTLRQTKRLSGLISNGAKLSMLVGGLAVPLLMMVFDVQALIIISVIMILSAQWNQKHILKTAAVQPMHPAEGISGLSRAKAELESNEDETEKATYKQYVRSILAIQAGLSAMYFALDNAFLAEVRNHCPTAEDVGSFLGYTSAAAALLSIVLGSLSGRFLVGRLGTIALVRLTPILVAGLGCLGIGVALVVPDSLWVLGILIAMHVGERACTPTIFYPSYDSLFQSLPQAQGAKYHGLSLTLSGPLAGAAVGVLLLLLGSVTNLSTAHLVSLVVVVSILMIVACQTALVPYRATLEYAVRSQRIERLALHLGDDESLRLLESGLHSERADEVIYAFELLRENAFERACQLHADLLSHPSMAVRVHMVEVLPQLKDPDQAERLIELLDSEAAPAVKASILLALAETQSENTHDVLCPYLEGDHHRLLVVAAAAMIKHGGLHSIIQAGVKLQELQASADAHERAMAAEIIGLIGNPAFYHGLEALMRDVNPAVRTAAHAAAGELGSPQLLPELLQGLTTPVIRATSLQALRSYGPKACDALWERISDGAQPLHLRRQALSLVSEHTTSDNRKRLVDQLKSPDLDHIHASLVALEAGGFRAQPEDQATIERLFEEEGGRAIDILTALQQYSNATMKGGVQLRETLDSEYRHIVERVMLLACFTMPGLPFRKICESVFRGRKKDIAFFCELIDERLSSHIASRVVPLIEPLETSRRIEKLCRLYNRQPKDALSQLTDIAKGVFTVHNPWLAVCASWFLDDLLRRGATDSGTHSVHNVQLEHRVQCLQNVKFFDGVPTPVLAHLLKFFQVRELAEHDVLVKRGESYQGLYLVEVGRLRGSKDEEYPARSYFGLESLFGEESVEETLRVVEPTRVLILSQDIFRLVMHDSLPVFSRVLHRLSEILADLIKSRREPDGHVDRTPAVVDVDNLIQQRLLLKRMTLFATIPPHNLDQIMANSRFRSVEAGQVILQEGSLVESLYLVASGSVALETEEGVHARLYEGDIFGKYGWMGHTPPMVTSVHAECDLVLLEIDGAVVESILWSDDTTIWSVLRHMNEQMHLFKKRLIEFTWF